MATNGMTIDGLNTVTSITAQDEVPVWDKEASGEPTRKITAQNMTNSVKTLGSLVNTTEMNTAIEQSTADVIRTGDVVNDLTSTATDKPGSANMLKTLNDKIDGIFTLIQNISVSPNSYTDIDYPSGYSQHHTMVVSVLIAKIYSDYSNIVIIFNANKIRINNPTQQSWEGIKILLTRI